MKKKRICSLFSGIGGIEQGIINSLGEENIDIVFSSEIDNVTRFAYEHIHGIQAEGDILEVDIKKIPSHEILIGGFPCQPYSISGLKEGFLDERGKLFFKIIEIAEQHQPEIIFLENVKNLISHNNGETFTLMLELLCSKGYAVDFSILNSKYFNSPQNRERVYICCKKIASLEEDIVDHWNIENKKTIVNSIKKKLNLNTNILKIQFNFPKFDLNKVSLFKILEKEVDCNFYIKKEYKEDLLKELQGKSLQELHNNKLDLNVVGRLSLKGHDILKRVYHPYGVSPTITTMGGGNREPKILIENSKNKLDVRKLTPMECLRVQNFSDNYYYILKEMGLSKSKIYHIAGNTVTTTVIKSIFDNIYLKKEQ